MGSLYAETMEALERNLTCSMIGSPVNGDGIDLTAALTDEAVRTYAQARGYWQVYLSDVRDQAEKSGEIAELDRETYEVHLRRPIGIADLLAGSTPIGRAIQLLRNRGFFLLLEHDRIEKILTRADLNRLPVRTYLHTLLDHLESLLGTEIVEAHPDDAWLGLLPDDARDRIRALHEKKRLDGLDTALIDCTTFSEKANIITASDNEPEKRLGMKSRTALRKALGRMRKLRDRLAHPDRLVMQEVDQIRNQLRHGDCLTRSDDVTKLADTVTLLHRWIEILDS